MLYDIRVMIWHQPPKHPESKLSKMVLGKDFTIAVLDSIAPLGLPRSSFLDKRFPDRQLNFQGTLGHR